MSNYRKRRSYPGNSSPPRKKRNTGKKFLKGIAITLAAIACISLLATLLPGRNPLTCEHDYKTELIKESCEDAGYMVYTCKHCDDTYKVQILFIRTSQNLINGHGKAPRRFACLSRCTKVKPLSTEPWNKCQCAHLAFMPRKSVDRGCVCATLKV